MMQANQIFSHENNGETSKFDTAIEWLLGGMLVFMPLLFGARDAWTEQVVIVMSGGIIVCFLFKIIVNPALRIAWSWAYLPLGLFFAVVVFQLIAFPSDMLSKLSPNTVTLRTELLTSLPGADEVLKKQTISLYPYCTKHDLRLLISLAAVFFVVLNVYRTPAKIKRLLLVIAMTGGLVALIALAQDIFGNGLRYWFIPHPSGGSLKTLSGPFVNHNHFGQFMNLSMGAAIAWLCVKLHEDFADKVVLPHNVLDYVLSPSAKRLRILVAMIALGAASVFISLTRGGMAGMLIAGVVTTLLLCCRGSLKGRAWVMVVMAFGAFSCILLIGFDAVYARFATLWNFEGFEYRWQTLKDLTACFAQFPVFGVGLGAHLVVYPMFQNIDTPLVFTHAENEYAQVLEETGIVGLALLLVFAVIILSNYIKNIRRAKSPIHSISYGLGFGLLAILIHSFSDYGQHLPANSFLSAIFCALLIVLAKWKKGGISEEKIKKAPVKIILARTACLLGVGAIFTWCVIDSDKARAAEAHWNKALTLEKSIKSKDWQVSGAEYDEMIYHTERAMQLDPENKTYHYACNLYRWYYMINNSQGDEKRIIDASQNRQEVENILHGLGRAILICPTYGPSYSLAGQIEKFVLYDQAGLEKIQTGFKLSPCDPMSCFVAGRLDVLQGRPEESISKFQKALNGDGKLFREIANIYINYLSRPHLAVDIAGENIGRLRYVSKALDDMYYCDLAQQCRQKADQLLETKCATSAVTAGDLAALAEVYKARQENEKAIECYFSALKFDYGQVNWRYNLANLLVETDKIPEALEQARICVRIRPQFKAAKDLVGKLLVSHQSITEKNK